jgi:hypothetical protein
VSSVELFNYLKKSLGIVIKRLEESGVLTLPTFLDHKFMPELEVSDTQIELPVSGLLYKVKVVDGAPVYLNIDRPITDEYTVVFPGTYVLIPRSAHKIYIKAPEGFKSKVRIEVLR